MKSHISTYYISNRLYRINSNYIFIALISLVFIVRAHAETSCAKESNNGSGKPAQSKNCDRYDNLQLDMVSDTVGQAFNKANAILTGHLDIEMGKRVQDRNDYTIDAMGRRVPKRTAINTGAALHTDQPL